MYVFVFVCFCELVCIVYVFVLLDVYVLVLKRKYLCTHIHCSIGRVDWLYSVMRGRSSSVSASVGIISDRRPTDRNLENTVNEYQSKEILSVFAKSMSM